MIDFPVNLVTILDDDQFRGCSFIKKIRLQIPN